MLDPTIRRLTKKIFPYLWLRHKLMSSVPSTGIFPFSEMTILSQGIGNAVIIYLHAYRPVLSSYLKKHIPSMPHAKMQFWEHVSFLCLQVRLLNDDVFDYFLTTCAITAEVALHCYMNGYDAVLSLASVFFCAFFENELCEGFDEAGGWEGLYQYIEDTSCKELYELVDEYVKELDSPSDRLPILITIQYEQLAAGRREKLESLSSLKVGEIEREVETSKLVSRIFHWHFMENYRMSETKPGTLKRMENVRHKKKPCISIVNGRHEDLSGVEKTLNVDKMSNSEPPSLNDDVQPSESISSMSETRLTKTTQTSDNTKLMKEGNLHCGEVSENIKSSLSSLRKLREFYESLSKSSEKKVDDSKYFRSNNKTGNELKSSAIEESLNAKDKINHFENYPKYPPNSTEDVKTLPQSKHSAPQKMSKLAELSTDIESEFTKSFEKLGFNCLCVRNSPLLDEKYTSFPNKGEVLEKCRYFQTKYPSIQFAILIPNNYSNDDSSHAPETEKSNGILSENKYSGQQSLCIVKEDSENGTASPQIHHPEDDKNQIRLANGLALAQICPAKNNCKSRFVVSKVDENDLCPADKTFKISRFSVSKVNENYTSRDETSLKRKYESETKVVSRFKVMRVNENHSNVTKISRFTVTEVDEKQLNDEKLISGKNLENETKISRFTVSKVNENQLNGVKRISGKSVQNETTKISRFTVSKVNERQLNDEKEISGKDCQNETTKISRFAVTKVNEKQLNDGTRILGKSWKNGTTEISRFTVTKVNENDPKDVASILRKNWKNGAVKKSRFSVGKVDENEPMSRSGMSLRKSCLTNATKLSRFADTDVDQTNLANQNYSVSGEFFDTDFETVHFQDNGSVKYQKRVSFDDHPFISYYQTYSSDDSFNSIASRESLAKTSQEDPQSSKNSGHNTNKEEIFDSKTSKKNLNEYSLIDSPSWKNPGSNASQGETPVNERRGFLKRFSSSDKQATSENTGSSNSSGSGLFDRFFKRSSRTNKMEESSSENKEETDKERMEELRMSLEAARARNPNLFKA